MTATPPDRRRTGLAAVLVFAASWLYLYLLQFQGEWLPSTDGWYHIKYASMLPSLGILDQFKWAAQSLWAEHFADKQVLYHLYLVPFTWTGDLVRGMKHATVLLGAGFVTSFWLVLRFNRFRFPWFWTLLLFAAGPWFLYRLCLPRPHVASMILLLWSLHGILNHRRKMLFVVTLVYSLSYTAFHVPFGLALILAAHAWFGEKRLEWKTPAVMFAAIVVGVLINPYFPDTLRWFWAMNVMVPWMALGREVDLGMARELAPYDTREFVLAHGWVLAGIAAAAYTALARGVRASRRTRELLIVFGIYALLVAMNRRFVEYSVPVGLLLLASYATDQLSGVDLAGLRRRFPWRVLPAAALLVLALAFTAWSSFARTAELIRAAGPHRREAAIYLAEHTDPDELVYTCDWDDAPELFFFNDKNRYPVIMDPYYMYGHDPKLWGEWYGIGAGLYGGRTYDMLARHYRYGVCTFDYEKLRSIVDRDPRMEVVFDDGQVWVFRLDLEHPEIPLDQFLEMAPGN